MKVQMKLAFSMDCCSGAMFRFTTELVLRERQTSAAKNGQMQPKQRCASKVFFCSGEAAHYVCVLAERSRLDWTHWHGPCVDSDGYVKGTREPAPSRIPQSKYDALFDKRHVFDAIRESFLFSAGTLDAMVILLEAVASDRHLSHAARAQLENFRSEVHHHSAALAEPQAMRCFGEEAWPYYVQALQDENYWLSVGELVLLCHLAGVRIIVFKQTGAVLVAVVGCDLRGLPVPSRVLLLRSEQRHCMPPMRLALSRALCLRPAILQH